MNNEQELIDEVNASRHRVKRIKSLIETMKRKLNVCEQGVVDAEEAYMKFMDDNGIKESECGEYKAFIRYSEQVDIADNAAVPDDFLRVKVSKEPNKMLIKELRPQANWYSIKSIRNLQVKLKG